MGTNHLALIGVMVDPLRGIIALSDEGSLNSKMGKGKVVVARSPLTVGFEEVLFEEGRGNSKSDVGWMSLSRGSRNCTDSLIASWASWVSNEGFRPRSYVHGEGYFSVFKEGYTRVGLGYFPKRHRYWKTVLTSPGKELPWNL